MTIEESFDFDNTDAAPVEIDIASLPHVAVKSFEQIVGDVMVRLQQGRIITDHNLIKKLLATRAPIVPVGAEKNLCVCPACKHIFALGGGSAAY